MGTTKGRTGPSREVVRGRKDASLLPLSTTQSSSKTGPIRILHNNSLLTGEATIKNNDNLSRTEELGHVSSSVDWNRGLVRVLKYN